MGISAFYNVFKDNSSNTALIVCEKKVTKKKVLKLYDGYLDMGEKVFFFNEFIEQIIVEDIAKSLHIGLTFFESSNEKYNKYSLLRSKIIDKVASSYSPPKNEKNYTSKSLMAKNSFLFADGWLHRKIENYKIVFVDSGLEKYSRKAALKCGDFTIDNVAFYNYFYSLLGGRRINPRNDHLAYKAVVEEYSSLLVLANEASNRGLQLSINLLSPMNRIYKMVEALKADIKKKIRCENFQLREHYNSNRKKYIEKERAYLKILEIPFKASVLDKQNAKKRAEEILTVSLKGNELPYVDFILSPSEFKKRFKISTINKKVHKNLLKEGDSYFIVKRDGEKVKMIDVKPVPSDESKEETLSKFYSISQQIENGNLNFESKVLLGFAIKDLGPIYINDANLEPLLLEKVFDANSGEIFGFVGEKKAYIVKRTKYFAAKSSFDDVKDKVKADYIEIKANEEINRLKEELLTRSNIEILDDHIKSKVNYSS